MYRYPAFPTHRVLLHLLLAAARHRQFFNESAGFQQRFMVDFTPSPAHLESFCTFLP